MSVRKREREQNITKLNDFVETKNEMWLKLSAHECVSEKEPVIEVYFMYFCVAFEFAIHFKSA